MKRYALIVLTFGLVLCGCQPTHTPEVVENKIANIYGLVQDKISGEFLSDVIIKSDSLQIGDVITGSDGNYSVTITYNTNRVINLKAQKVNYESEEQIIDLKEISNNPQKSIDFQLRMSAIIYNGVVTDGETNQIMSGVKIHAKIQHGSYIGSVGTVFTDDQGQYNLELPKPDYESWTYYITADINDYYTQTYSMSHTQADIGKIIPLNFEMEHK